jgi:hypothetical protein
MLYLKNYILLLSLLSWVTFAEQTSYQSIANELKINSNGDVDVKVVLLHEGDEITCGNDEYDFRFSIEPIVGQRWYDTLLLSRSTSNFVDFIYDVDNCQLSAIALPKYYDDGSSLGEETPEGGLEETGENGNVALIGSNGLFAESYSSSSFYGQDSAAAAFDGFVFSVKENQDANEKVGRGLWLANNIDADGNLLTPWLQVDFGRIVTLTGMRTFINNKSLELGRSPSAIILYTSIDGGEFEEISEFQLSLDESVGIDFSESITARFFRFEVINNYGDENYVEIDELELFQ